MTITPIGAAPAALREQPGTATTDGAAFARQLDHASQREPQREPQREARRERVAEREQPGTAAASPHRRPRADAASGQTPTATAQEDSAEQPATAEDATSATAPAPAEAVAAAPAPPVPTANGAAAVVPGEVPAATGGEGADAGEGPVSAPRAPGAAAPAGAAADDAPAPVEPAKTATASQTDVAGDTVRGAQPSAAGSPAPSSPEGAGPDATAASAVVRTGRGDGARVAVEAMPRSATEAGAPASPASAAPTERPLVTTATAGVDSQAAPASASAAAALPAPGAAASLASTAAPAAAPTPHPPLAPQLAPQLAHLRALPDGEHVLTLTVDPEHFGPVKVVAHITPEGASIQLLGSTEAGREALKAALADLRRDLAATGMRADLDLGSDHGAEPGSDRRGMASDGRPLPPSLDVSEPAGVAAGPLISPHAAGTARGVDLYL